MYTNVATPQQLKQNRTSLVPEGDLPAFSLNFDQSQTSDPTMLDEEMDVVAVPWKEPLFSCPNETKSGITPTVAVEIYKKGTAVPHPIPAQAQLKTLYPYYSGNSCQAGCDPVSSSGIDVVECLCEKLSELSLDNQLLNVLEQSNLRKLGSISALKEFSFISSTVFWIQVTLFVIVCIYSLYLLGVNPTKRSSPASMSSIRWQPDKKGTDTVIVVSTLLIAFILTTYRQPMHCSHCFSLKTSSIHGRAGCGYSTAVY